MDSNPNQAYSMKPKIVTLTTKPHVMKSPTKFNCKVLGGKVERILDHNYHPVLIPLQPI